VVSALRRWFDLAADARAARAKGASPRAGRPLPVLPQYAALAAGVFAQPLLEGYRADGAWDVARALSRVPFALVVGLVLFPAVYRRTLDPEKPLFVQLCLVFAAGVGWQSLWSLLVP
jgi:hypothetical protein